MKRRNTPAKQSILNILKSSGTALSQEMIEAEVKGEMDRVTIYRVLNSFCEDGITHRILADNGKYYFALCLSCNEKQHSHDHFHFRCLKCEKVECLHEKVKVTLPEGYVSETISSWISGYCNTCS
ncbi:Fur family transcriptional regulator [Flavobacterium sp. MK4S-17]|uniref:Fur family transcriptional regulator n=1 Tax=Flavobacterium sp. MK4S-17 TaxID=2543737 RepID=UPI001358AC51|nr:transcriptional repressor [Flavobacterium sp. MK4S-17]